MIDSVAKFTVDVVNKRAMVIGCILLRGCFVKIDLWTSFSNAMNMLGYEGRFSFYYVFDIKEASLKDVRNEMIRIGKITE